MVPPMGGATARWTSFEHRNHFFKARRSRPRLLRGYFTQNAPKRYGTRGACYAALMHTLLLPGSHHLLATGTA